MRQYTSGRTFFKNPNLPFTYKRDGGFLVAFSIVTVPVDFLTPEIRPPQDS